MSALDAPAIVAAQLKRKPVSWPYLIDLVRTMIRVGAIGVAGLAVFLWLMDPFPLGAHGFVGLLAALAILALLTPVVAYDTERSCVGIVPLQIP